MGSNSLNKKKKNQVHSPSKEHTRAILFPLAFPTSTYPLTSKRPLDLKAEEQWVAALILG